MGTRGTRLAALLIAAAGMVGGTAGVAQAAPQQAGSGHLFEQVGPFQNQAACISEREYYRAFPDVIGVVGCGAPDANGQYWFRAEIYGN
jgi:hypothetical protein